MASRGFEKWLAVTAITAGSLLNLHYVASGGVQHEVEPNRYSSAVLERRSLTRLYVQSGCPAGSGGYKPTFGAVRARSLLHKLRSCLHDCKHEHSGLNKCAMPESAFGSASMMSFDILWRTHKCSVVSNRAAVGFRCDVTPYRGGAWLLKTLRPVV